MISLRRFIPIGLLIALLLSTSACVSFLNASRSEPIATSEVDRSLGEKIDDRNIRTVIAVNIDKADPELAKSPVNVHAFRGVVLLTGQVPSEKLRTLAETTARDVARVREVHNELAISNAQRFIENLSDSALETKIDSKLLVAKGVRTSRVKVIVEDGTVYLLGLMTAEEAERVTEVISNTSGVTRLVRAIEYVEP